MKLSALLGVRGILCGSVLGAAAFAQSAPAPAPSIHWSAVLDAYFQAAADPASNQTNTLRAFDDRIGHPTLNMAKLSFDMQPKPVGFHLEAGAGHIFDVVGSGEKKLPAARYLEQAYLSFEGKSWRGARVDLGRFVTSAGAEVIDTTANWNYSRSLLFTFAIPFNHTGVRSTAPLGKQFTAGLQLVSGWNNIVSGATYRTVGATGSWTNRIVTVNATVYRGPDENRADRGMRTLYDAVIVWNPSQRLQVYGNMDYGRTVPRVASLYSWSGYAGAARLRLKGHTDLSARVETLRDASGNVTGTTGRIAEATVTAAWSPVKNFVSYLEFRDDRVIGGASRNYPGVLVGTVLSFGAVPPAP